MTGAPVSGMTPSGEARIVDRGYQHYTGERYGAAAGLRAIAIGTMRRSLGFKRPGSAKILPFALVLLAFMPGAIVLGVRVLFGAALFGRGRLIDQVLPYDGYAARLATLLLLLAALTAPEALCPDRRQRVLSLYYASPISPLLYLLAQAIAVMTVLLLVTMMPLLLLWLGNVGLDADPWAYLRAHADAPLRILGAGGLVALFYAVLGLAVSSFTDRKGYAAGAMIGGALILSAVANTVRVSVHQSWAKYAALVDPVGLPQRAERWVFGKPQPSDLAGIVYLAAAIGIIALAGFLVVRVYRSLNF